MEDKIKKLHDLLGEMELKLKKISGELNRKPREFWVNEYKDGKKYVYEDKRNSELDYPNSNFIGTIHVREVIDE